MDGSNNFALVRKPSSTVERVAPRAKRVLSGMIADTLAVAKKRSSPRIVIVDDEPMLLKLAELVVRKWFVNVTILTFETGEQAWAEILKTEPDLLITDMARAGMGGREMLPLLAEKNIKFPILVTSGSATEEQVRQVAGSKLKVAFLSKPYTQAEIFHWLAIFVGSSDNPQSHEL